MNTPLLLFRWLWICMMVWIVPAHSYDLVTEHSYWRDSTGTATFAEARDQVYTPYRGILNLGSTSSATWVRLRIAFSGSHPQDRYIVLRVQPNFIDEVELFDPIDPHELPRKVGDRTLYAAQEYKSPTYSFILPVGQEDRSVWLRMKSVNLNIIRVEAFGEAEMQIEEKNRWLEIFSCLGLLLFLLVFNVFNWLWNRDWYYTVFVFRMIFLTCQMILYFGLGRLWLDHWIQPEWLDDLFNLSVIATTGIICYSEFGLLGEYGLKTWARWAQRGIYAAWTLPLLLYGVGLKSNSIHLNILVIAMTLLLLFCTTLFGLKHDYPKTQELTSGIHRRFFSGYFALILTILIIFFLFNSNLNLPFKHLLPEVLSVIPHYALTSSVFMTLIIQLRATHIRKNNKRLELEMALLDENISHERIRRQEQSHLLNMLMHELRNPLAVIEMAQQQKNPGDEVLICRNVGVIRGVLERTMKLERINEEKLVIEKRRFLLSDSLMHAIEEANIDEGRLVLNRLPDEYIYTDEECLRTIMVNLLGNAFKYSPPDDVITLEATRDPQTQQLVIVVTNRLGAGGPPDPERVFEKYYRGEGSKNLPGTGVGLYLVAQLAQRMGGECRCFSDGSHIHFEVSFPAENDS